MNKIFKVFLEVIVFSQNVQTDNKKKYTNLKSCFDLFRLSKSTGNLNFKSFRLLSSICHSSLNFLQP